MKSFSKVLAPVALAAGVLMAGSASAAIIYSGPLAAGGDTYIGAYDATAFDVGFFGQSLTTIGMFSEVMVFDFSPIGSATTNANFVPTSNISGFMVELLSATGSLCGAVGTSCGTVTLGATIATGAPGFASSNIGFTGLSAGTYAIRVSGNVTSAPVSWTGQLATSPVPEPTSIALVGLALVGLGAARRKAMRK